MPYFTVQGMPGSVAILCARYKTASSCCQSRPDKGASEDARRKVHLAAPHSHGPILVISNWSSFQRAMLAILSSKRLGVAPMLDSQTSLWG